MIFKRSFFFGRPTIVVIVLRQENTHIYIQQKLSTLAVKMIKMRAEMSKKSSTRVDTVNEQSLMAIKKRQYANLTLSKRKSLITRLLCLYFS